MNDGNVVLRDADRSQRRKLALTTIFEVTGRSDDECVRFFFASISLAIWSFRRPGTNTVTRQGRSTSSNNLDPGKMYDQ